MSQVGEAFAVTGCSASPAVKQAIDVTMKKLMRCRFRQPSRHGSICRVPIPEASREADTLLRGSIDLSSLPSRPGRNKEA